MAIEPQIYLLLPIKLWTITLATPTTKTSSTLSKETHHLLASSRPTSTFQLKDRTILCTAEEPLLEATRLQASSPQITKLEEKLKIKEAMKF